MKKLASRPAGAWGLPLATFAFLAGCSGEASTPPQPPPQPVAETPSEAHSAAPAPPPSASAAPEAPAPSASAAASAPPPKPQSSGRPAVLKSDPVEVTDTFGSNSGAKIEIGDKEIATLKIPEQGLGQATNITFKLDPKGKATGAQVGKIYHITPVLPPDGKPVSVESNNGVPFELQLPAGNKKNANLAIGSIEVDDKGQQKIKWQVIAPKRIDDATGVAYFELMTLTDAFLHVTTKPPTEAKK